MPRFSYLSSGDEDSDESEEDLLESGTYRSKIISNDTTGEKIYVMFYRSPRYFYSKDSTELDKDNDGTFWGDTSWIVRSKKKYELPNKMKVREKVLSDTGSSRVIWIKSFYKEGIGFSLMTQSDTLTRPSAFLKSFFDSFTPADTLKGVNPFTKKSNLFFSDFMSPDTIMHKRAVKNIDNIDLDSTDLPQLKKAIAWLNWSEKKYLDTKKSLIEKFGDIKTAGSADHLKDLYYALDDTVDLQYTVLESLLQQETAYSYSVFRDIVNTEPPVLSLGSPGSYYDYPDITGRSGRSPSLRYSYDNGNFLDELSDSLQLTRTILPDLLPLLNLEDYKSSIMGLLGEMIDSNLIKPKDYELYFSKFLIEAKQELKKQSIAEKKKAIHKAEQSKVDDKSLSVYEDDEDTDSGNDDLRLYATLLLPFRETNPNVQPLIQQMLRSNDKRLKYNIMMLLLRNDKPYPDTLMSYFAGMDEFRYELYKDLKDLKKTGVFPARYNNHLDLGKSKLLDRSTYGKPDSLVYVDRLSASFKGKKGFIYFYKYKVKKDDLSWKLAMIGLTPEDPKQFEFTDSMPIRFSIFDYSLFNSSYNRYDFTGFLDTNVNEDEPLVKQMNTVLKKALYSRRKSAKEFYNEEDDSDDVEITLD
jgi:hypothetical protein